MRLPTCFLRSISVLVLLTGSLVLLVVPRSKAQSNTVDPMFGGAGLGLAGNVSGLFLQPDGKLLVAGGLNGLARLNTDGTTDYSFSASVNEQVYAAAVGSNGSIVLCGNFTQVNGVANAGLVRLNADGSTDASFNGSADAALASNALTVALQSDGKVLVGSNTVSFTGGANTPGITRLNTDGSLDASFAGSVNRATSSAVKTIIVQGDGKILLGGFFSQVDGVASNNLARLNTDGTLDGTFVPAAAPASFLAALQPDGKVLIGSESAPGLIRLNSDGSVDATFHYAGTDASYVYTGSPNLAALEPGGQIVLYDYASGTLSRVNADGSADTGFHPAANGVVDAVVPQADGTVVLGGDFTQVNGFAVNSVARLLADGTVDTSYTPDVTTGPNGQVISLGAQSDGSVVLTGAFTEVDGAAHSGIARLNSDGTTDANYNASVTNAPDNDLDMDYVLAVQGDDKVLLGGEFSAVNGVAFPGLVRLNTDGTLDLTFNASVTGFVTRITLQTDGRILVGGAFGSVNGTAEPGVARLNTDGSVDTSFSPAFSESGFVGSVVVQADGKILLGFIQDGGTGEPAVLRLNADGSLDASFNAAISYTAGGTTASAEVLGIAVQADGKILVGGTFTTVDGITANDLARLNADGTLDATFSASTDAGVGSIIAEADGTIVIGGGFTQVDGAARGGLAHLSADGTLNPFTSAETGVNGTVSTLRQQTDGKVLLGGDFNSVDGVQRNFVARLTSGGVPDFFGGSVSVGGGFYYKQFASGVPFGYYNLVGSGYSFPYFYHADLGTEYFFDANDSQGGAYLYDFASDTFFYTSASFPFPYLYDFTLNSVLYYYPDTTNPGHYTSGPRYFYDFATGAIITK